MNSSGLPDERACKNGVCTVVTTSVILAVERGRYLGVLGFQGLENMLHNQNNTRAVLTALLNDMYEPL